MTLSKAPPGNFRNVIHFLPAPLDKTEILQFCEGSLKQCPGASSVPARLDAIEVLMILYPIFIIHLLIHDRMERRV